jgi:hypothetical protein
MYIFKNFPGENPRPKGRPRLTRREMGDGGEGKGWNPQNLYAAYAHGCVYIHAKSCSSASRADETGRKCRGAIKF